MKAIFSDDYKKLIKELKKARLARGLTQKQLSLKLGYSQSYVSKIEQGQTRLDVMQLKELSKALCIDFGKLLR
jgi:transcriptional regulator with XRE-family HTH domain